MSNKTIGEQYKCQSYYDDNDVLKDCNCGECVVGDLLVQYYNLVSNNGADYSSLDKDVVTNWLRTKFRTLLTEKDREREEAYELGRKSVLDELEEEQKKFTQGFAYRSPDRPINFERE